MKTELNADEFWSIVGLAILANRLSDQMTSTVLAIARITGENLDEYDYGHASDLVYDLNVSALPAVRGMLRNLDIEYTEEFNSDA